MAPSKLRPTRRAGAAIAAVVAASVGGYVLLPGGDKVPAPVALAMENLVQPWEGRELRAYRDVVGVLTICDGDTANVRPGMVETPAGCDTRLRTRLVRDFYVPLTRCIAGFEGKPQSWQAMMTSLAYNVGVGATCNSTAARLGRGGQYRASCEAATAFNRAGGKVLIGLQRRREMGDATRIGEGELCVTGLE
ncbi:lysozyme [Ancylobacter sp. SL191]|uniref:lysozyme n=1 Tax=Ancylobacter sp. SL191 TaxID=2995166 RepID=UPI00226FDCD9|nr:lysozyme [Ancylobacter sp. SL191]WAC26446.1 lysozyme [Ancylobacter sp. SL191]